MSEYSMSGNPCDTCVHVEDWKTVAHSCVNCTGFSKHQVTAAPSTTPNVSQLQLEFWQKRSRQLHEITVLQKRLLKIEKEKRHGV